MAGCTTFAAAAPALQATNFTQAARTAGLSGLLSDPTLQQMLFVPTDPAFETFATQLGIPVSQLLTNAPLAQQIVRNSIVPGLAVEQGALFNGQQLVTLAGQTVSVVVQKDIARFTAAGNLLPATVVSNVWGNGAITCPQRVPAW